MARLTLDFYTDPDVERVAIALLGCVLWSCAGGNRTAARIVETEAYGGSGADRASHAARGRTARNDVMFERGGRAYVYLCYGLHHLFNVVTGAEGCAAAVLVRAVEPMQGVAVMEQRRGMGRDRTALTAGPGALTTALGINMNHNRCPLVRGGELWFAGPPGTVAGDEVVASARVGVNYAGDDAARPWRFRIRGNRWTSPAR